MDKDRIFFYLLAVFAGALAGIGDVLLSEWAKHGSSKSYGLLGGFIFWNISLIAFLPILKRETLAQAVVLYITANCLVALGISYFSLHEVLTKQQWLGVMLAVGGLIVMEIGRK